MDQKNELSMNEMEQATGGVQHEVQTGIPGLDAAIRKEPRKSSRQIGHVANGTKIETVSDTLIYDSESKRNFVQIYYNGGIAYIAASLVGLPR